MKTRKIGNLQVGEIGFGAMPLSLEDNPDHDTAIQVIHKALELGFTHLDTAFAYYRPDGRIQDNEKLIAEALSSYAGDKSKVTVATKTAAFRYMGADNTPMWGLNAAPPALIECARRSKDALGVTSIDLLYHHRPDLNYPYADQLKAMKSLVEEGTAKQIGLSNVSVDQIKLGQEILGEKFVAVQNQFSPVYVATYAELKYCAANNLAFVCWSPLGGYRTPVDQVKFAVFEEIARAHNVSRQQVILQWELNLAPNVIPIPGFRRVETLEDSAKAEDLQLTDEEVQQISGVVLKETIG